MVDYLTLDSDLITIRSKTINSRPLKEVSEATKSWIKAISILIIPILVIILGLVKFYLQKKEINKFQSQKTIILINYLITHMNSKSKNTLILLISLIILVGIYFIWQNPFADTSRNQIQTENILAQDLSQAQKIEISRNTASTVLEKNDSIWVVASDNNKPANEALIEDLLSTLTENQTATIVSLSADNLEKYGLNEEAASKLQISDGQNNLLAVIFF